MRNYNLQIHQRRSIRLKGYDYTQAGMYFITICCQDRAHLFGQVKNGKMILNIYGQIAHNAWLQSQEIRNNIALHEFIVMPNHIHGIIEIIFKQINFNREKQEIGKLQSPSQTIGSIIRGFKIATIKKIKDEILIRTGEFSTGELQFAPTEFAPTEKIKNLDFKIWQRNYYENIIRNEQAYQRISGYIINNPQKWEDSKS